MKHALIGFEPSLWIKKLHLATRKVPCILQKSLHPGLVHTASAGRDVSLMCLAFGLEGLSLYLLWWLLPFHPGIVAGLAAFDTAGALLMHAGVADANLRAARTAVAVTEEEKAAIAAQRAWYYPWLRALGAVFILVPMVFKITSLFLLPHALVVLGGLAPALMVAFAGIALIHLFITGYALAHLRHRRAEQRELLALLRSAEMASDREAHANHIKAARAHHFATPLRLNEAEHTDGHRLHLLHADPDGLLHYELETRGRFDDPDLAFFVHGQQGPLEQMEVCRQGLIHQLLIEQSEPLASARQPARAALTAGEADSAAARRAVKNSAPAAAMLVLALAAAFGLASCKPEKPETLHMTLVSTRPLAASPAAPLPESVLGLLAPARPLAGRFVPCGQVLRIDLGAEAVTDLTPREAEANAAQKAVQAAWQVSSPVIELAKAADYLRGQSAGPLARQAAHLSEPSLAEKLAALIHAARAEGREVLALSPAARDGVVKLAKDLSLDARPTVKDALQFIEEKLRAGINSGLLVLLDPPVFEEPQPLSGEARFARNPPQPAGESKTGPADDAKPATPEKKAAETGAAVPAQVLSVPGNSTTVIVNQSGKAEIAVQLPEGARPVGSPVLFATNSARLAGTAPETISGIAAAIKAGGLKRVILIASADASGSEQGNAVLARQRGEVVAAALLKHGVVVEQVLSVGDSLAPEIASRDQKRDHRSVCVFSIGDAAPATGAF